MTFCGIGMASGFGDTGLTAMPSGLGGRAGRLAVLPRDSPPPPPPPLDFGLPSPPPVRDACTLSRSPRARGLLALGTDPTGGLGARACGDPCLPMCTDAENPDVVGWSAKLKTRGLASSGALLLLLRGPAPPSDRSALHITSISSSLSAGTTTRRSTPRLRPTSGEGPAAREDRPSSPTPATVLHQLGSATGESSKSPASMSAEPQRCCTLWPRP